MTYFAESASPDGVLTFQKNNTTAESSIWTLSPNGDRKPALLVGPIKSSFVDESAFSPDGRWVVYESGESNGVQVFVQPFPPTGAKYQISATSAGDPVWSPDGRQIIYTDVSGKASLVAVDVRTQPSFTVGKPTPLPIDGFVQRGGRPYDVMPDGRQFIVMLPPSETKTGGTLEINVVLNWFQDLKQRVPVK
jgi:Tol biopolymer transport system component